MAVPATRYRGPLGTSTSRAEPWTPVGKDERSWRGLGPHCSPRCQHHPGLLPGKGEQTWGRWGPSWGPALSIGEGCPELRHLVRHLGLQGVRDLALPQNPETSHFWQARGEAPAGRARSSCFLSLASAAPPCLSGISHPHPLWAGSSGLPAKGSETTCPPPYEGCLAPLCHLDQGTPDNGASGRAGQGTDPASSHHTMPSLLQLCHELTASPTQQRY